MLKLRNPDRCPECQGQSKVMDTRNCETYRWRRRKCLACGELWRTYESLINPMMVRLRQERTS